ncbi:hypothetical protein C3L33_00705, partial [Rhododendron williamsianum]
MESHCSNDWLVVTNCWTSTGANGQPSEKPLEHSFEQEARNQEGNKNQG